MNSRSFSSLFVSSVFVAALLGRLGSALGQTFRATLRTASLETTSLPQWSRDLGYQANELYPLTIGSTGCPFVDVNASGVKVSLMLDSGTSRGFVVTNNAPPFPHVVEGHSEELNADGTHRGESSDIRVETLSVLGKVFKDVRGSLSDWKMYSSEPFDGTVGLDFFLDRRLTLDYRAGRVGVTDSPLPEKLDRSRYVSIDLVVPPKSQGRILYARAKVNGRDALVYFDTGYNVSFIDPSFANVSNRVERTGKYKAFREGIRLELAGQKFVLDDLRESALNRGSGFDLPVALTLGSDVLSHFIVAIDVHAQKLILALGG